MFQYEANELTLLLINLFYIFSDYQNTTTPLGDIDKIIHGSQRRHCRHQEADTITIFPKHMGLSRDNVLTDDADIDVIRRMMHYSPK